MEKEIGVAVKIVVKMSLFLRIKRSAISAIFKAAEEKMYRTIIPVKAMAFHLMVLALAHTTESLPEPNERDIE